MAYFVTYFSELIKKYPTWEKLYEYLITLENGILEIGDKKNDYVIIKYNKSDNHSKESYDNVKWFRSVVWDTVRNIPLSVSPPKSESTTCDCKKLDELNITGWQDFKEGTMINVFSSKDDELEVCSRTKFDATGKFYSKKSFMELFTDALKNYGMNEYNEVVKLLPKKVDGVDGAHDANYVFDSPPESYFSSLLLQHPDNRIVEKINRPYLYVIYQGYVCADGNVLINEDMANIDDNMKIPYKLFNKDMAEDDSTNPAKYEKIDDFVTALSKIAGWCWQGIVLKDINGRRWKVRSPNYSFVRELRCSNNPRSDVRFMKLRQKNLVDTYLYYYPEERNLFSSYEKRVIDIVNKLYKAYVDVYITHVQKLEFSPVQYKPHLYALHGLYITQLKPAELFIRKKDVMNYVHKLEWQRLLFLMNYHLRPNVSGTDINATSEETPVVTGA
jgi:hypothetical protein